MLDAQYQEDSYRFLQIEQAKQEWEVTADSLSSVVCLVDRHAQILRANRAIESWHLGQVSRIKGLGLHTLFHPDCRDMSCYLSRFLSQAWDILCHNEPVGCEAWDQVLQRNLNVQLRPISSSQGKPSLCAGDVAVSIISDVTERKQIEQTRHIREQEYHNFVEQISVPVAIFRHLRLLFVNPAFAVMFDYTPEELYGMNLLELFARRDRELVNSRLSSLPSQNIERQWDAVGVTRQGRKILLDIEQTALKWQGQPAFLLTILDNTALTLREMRLEKELALLKRQNLPFNPVEMSFQEAVEAFEKHLLRNALHLHGGNQRKTSDRLGIPPKTLYRKIGKYGLKVTEAAKAKKSSERL